MPPEPWKGILDATQIPVGCLELGTDGNSTKGREDCLNLNVYTPLVGIFTYSFL